MAVFLGASRAQKGFKKRNKPINGAGKGNTRAVKHLLHVYRRMLSCKLNSRMALAKVLQERGFELIADVVKTMLLRGTIEQYLRSIDDKIVLGTKVVPIVETWVKLATHDRVILQIFGLECQIKPSSVHEMLNAHDEPQPEGEPRR
ncbi:MAG: hypothetical protein ACM3TN_22815 [Alphaproteobacteria bacterium]